MRWFLLPNTIGSTSHESLYTYQTELGTRTESSASIDQCGHAVPCRCDRLPQSGISPEQFVAPSASLHFLDLVLFLFPHNRSDLALTR